MKSRAEKERLCGELHEKFGRATVAILTSFGGIPVEEMRVLRRQLRDAGGEFRVVKNSVARRAAEGTAVAEASSLFEGPVAVTLGYDDPVLPAKVLHNFLKKTTALQIKTGIIEGKSCAAAQVASIASMPSRDVILGQLARGLAAPPVMLARSLQAVVAKLARVLTAVQGSRSATE